MHLEATFHYFHSAYPERFKPVYPFPIFLVWTISVLCYESMDRLTSFVRISLGFDRTNSMITPQACNSALVIPFVVKERDDLVELLLAWDIN